MRFLFKLALWVGLMILGSYIVMDNPKATYTNLYNDTACKLNSKMCPPVIAKMVLPGVAVFFVDKALALREGRQVAIMAEDWPYCDDGTGEVFLILKNFETDFASIPGWAQFYVKPSDKKIVGGAIAHDWLYALGGTPADVAKKRADEIFRRELKNAGVNIIKRNIMFQAVSRFGGKNFGATQEMGFRDPKTGVRTTRPVPSTIVVDNLGEGCPGFYEKYWNPRRQNHGLGYDLNPQILFGWIDL